MLADNFNLLADNFSLLADSCGRVKGVWHGRLHASKPYKGILQGDADEWRNAAAPGSDAGGDADAPRLALHGGRVICYYCARGVDCDAVEAGLVAAHGGGELGRGIGAAGNWYYYGGGVGCGGCFFGGLSRVARIYMASRIIRGGLR